MTDDGSDCLTSGREPPAHLMRDPDAKRPIRKLRYFRSSGYEGADLFSGFHERMGELGIKSESDIVSVSVGNLSVFGIGLAGKGISMVAEYTIVYWSDN